MAKLKRSILLAISDPHCGYELGLTNPETNLTDQHGKPYQIPPMTVSQEFLWSLYLRGIENVKALAEKDPIHVLWMGDLTHGLSYMEQQLSTRMSDQIIYASYAMEPVYQIKNIKSSRMAFGTGGHVFGQGSSEILLSTMLSDRFPKIDTRALYHGLAHYGGFTVDYAHHGPGVGSRNWTKNDSARNYIKSKMMDDLDADSIPADLTLRGHYHSFVRAWHGVERGGKWYEGWMVVMPPMCLPGDYARKVTASVYRVSPGIVAIEIINDRLYDIHAFTETLDMRTVENL